MVDVPFASPDLPEGPPEPMLLDTCVIQNLEWVSGLEESGVDRSESLFAEMRARFGTALAEELVALDYLVDRLQWRGGFPWLVSAATEREFERIAASKGDRLRAGWRRFADTQEEWGTDSYGPVAPGVLRSDCLVRPNPLILRGLGVATVDEIVADDGPLRAFRDRGDRELIRDALLSGVPAILTTDLRSLWSKRGALGDYGLEVWRPSDTLRAYIPVWNAEDEEFARRRAAAAASK
jgi:hypothetical protein